MKLVTFRIDSALGATDRVGAIDEDGAIVDLRAAYVDRLCCGGAGAGSADCAAATIFGDMRGLVGLGEWGRECAAEALEHARGANGTAPWSHDQDAVSLRAPIQPLVYRDCIAFEAHIRASYTAIGREMPDEWYELPAYYKGNPTTFIGSDEDVRWPSYSSAMDFELELGLVVGPGGRDIGVTRAPEHIYGLMVLNDFSARDIQLKEMAVGLGPAKGKDFATAIGPYLVTVDELEDLYDLEMVARVNGEEWCRGTSGSIHWRFEQMIEHISRDETLHAGDVIGSGTVGGGCGFELGRALEHGDVVELEVGGIGVLRNRVHATVAAGLS